MDKNASTAYVEPSGLIGGALATTGETGTPLFLINLCASMAPVQLASKTLPGLESYRLYQVTRVEDGRTRYRLRLGFFASEAEAEEVLAKVREHYPTAFTACLCAEDQRHTRGYVLPAAAKANIAVVPAAPKPAPSIAASKAPAAAPAVAPKAAAAATQAAALTSKTGIAKTKPTTSAPSATAVSKPAQQATAKVTPAPPSAPTKSQNAPAAPIGTSGKSWNPPPLGSNSGSTMTATGRHQTVAAVSKTQPVIKATPPTKSAVAAKSPPKPDSAESMRTPALELTFSDPPAPIAAAKPRSAPNEPFHVGKGVDIPTTALSLQSETSAAKPVAPSASAPSKPTMTKVAAPSTVSAPVPTLAGTAPTKVAMPAATAVASPTSKQQPAARHPDLDSTQTIRALTSAELADDSQEKWFAIQLAASEQPVNLDAMPHLDIFEAYRLYSVAIAGSGKIVHSLRLGFFKEAVSAEAVAGYLKTFFSSPTVLRISAAEQARFKDATLPKKADPEVRAAPNVIELDTARASRVPTVTMEVVPSVDTAATGSFKPNATGSFRTSDTAKHRTLSAVKPAAKNAAPATKRAPMPSKKTSSTGKYKMPVKKSLAEQLLDEAKEVELSESGIYKMPKNESLLSRLVDKLKK